MVRVRLTRGQVSIYLGRSWEEPGLEDTASTAHSLLFGEMEVWVERGQGRLHQVEVLPLLDGLDVEVVVPQLQGRDTRVIGRAELLGQFPVVNSGAVNLSLPPGSLFSTRHKKVTVTQPKIPILTFFLCQQTALYQQPQPPSWSS